MLLSLLLTVIIFGILAWVVMSIPIPQPFKNIVWAIMLIIAVLYIGQLFGIVPLYHGPHNP